ncbi:metallophosphoesterase [Verrucomicrobiaceae bacterium N1E253]|uniref:Metallophosphoesterase n=1 Tax=Oceaniferula marina TaxID=2748318 RepID=A0A851GN66_9BACT|nr:metallophosphoesterase [Oceaniferula marina]NWK56280.1 metallophosphoesterase [Oceaniferula marina]
MKRRTFLGSLAAASSISGIAAADEPKAPGVDNVKLLSPPVIQNPGEDAFTVAWAVSGMATGWVEWGTTPELGKQSIPAHHGLMSMSEYALSARIENLPTDTPIYYRTVTIPIHYKNAYAIERGTPLVGKTRKLKLPTAEASSCSLTMVNDTHDHADTLNALAKRIEAINPDAHLWNGDACNDFHNPQLMARICLTPGQHKDQPEHGGWASTRPLLFVPGNHDVRGRDARTMPEALTPWPLNDDDPHRLAPTPLAMGRYCFAKRIGPVAIIGLDTGEDKPDNRDVFGGMAAYEPYREAQRDWLLKVLQQNEIKNAPYLLAFCHIPLIGLEGENDGTGDTGYASYSGFGQQLWLKPLVDAGCQMLFSGHTHRHRIDKPSQAFPIYQVVGGGPKTKDARLIHIQADNKQLNVKVEDLNQTTVNAVTLKPRS